MCAMSIEPLTSEPATIYCGDTISWKISLPDYPATAGWVLKYNAVSSAGVFALVSVADGSDHLVSAAKATTDAFTPGNYSLVKFVDNGTELVTLEQIPLIVKPNLAGATVATDARSANEIILAAIDAAMLGTASSDQKRIKLGDKEIERHSQDSLTTFRNNYALAVWQERHPGELAPQIQLHVRDRYGR